MDRYGEMEAFLQVVDQGGFTEASKALGLSPSAVSKLISRLEDRLGARLLQRTTRRVSLTAEGRVYADQVREILADIDAVEASVGGAEAEPRGRLRINVAHGFGMAQIVPLIPDFLARYPKVDVQITFADHVVDLVAEGEDMGIRLGELHDDALIARKLGEHHRIICAAPGYLQKHGTPRTPDDLDKHNCLLFDGPEGLNEWPFRRSDGSIERRPMQGSFRSNNGDAVLRLLLDGVGLCYAADFGIKPYIENGRLVPVLADHTAQVMRPVHVVYPARKHLAAKVRVFADYLIERFSPEPPWKM